MNTISHDDIQSARYRLKEYSEESLRSVATLIDYRTGSCQRNSQDQNDSLKQDVGDIKFRPTAHAHLAITMVDFGLLYNQSNSVEAKRSCETKIKTTSNIKATDRLLKPLQFPNYAFLLQAMIPEYTANDDCKYEDGVTDEWREFGLDINNGTDSDLWVRELLKKSSHYVDGEPGHPNEAIFLGHMLHALFSLMISVPHEEACRAFSSIVAGTNWMAARLASIVNDSADIVSQKMNEERREYYSMSPYLLCLSARGLRTAGEIHRWLKENLVSEAPGEKTDNKLLLQIQSVWADVSLDWKSLEISIVKSALDQIAYHSDQIVHRMMARRDIEHDSEFDAIQLCYALRAHEFSPAKDLSSNLKFACVEQIVKAQLADGLWPDGYVGGVDEMPKYSMPQPSAEIALCLSLVAFDRDLLVNPSIEDMKTARLALSALVKFCNNSHMQMQKIVLRPVKKIEARGWCNDRIRNQQVIDTWVTCLVARTMHLTYLLSEACNRHRIIQKYNGRYHEAVERSKGRTSMDMAFRKMVAESDHITNPTKVIFDIFLSPIGQQEAQNAYIARTTEGGTSFILFGPPGSGKTHVMNSIAQTLGWPIIELSPGTFINTGLEQIEGRATEVFSDLASLFHVVVLFDECDELFRQRPRPNDLANNGERNILSFATASMLPKLQRLHDEGAILFAVATNYVANIDDAIRRQGRFDEIVLLDRPDRRRRKEIAIELMESADEKFAENGELPDKIADETGGMAYLDVRLYTQAMLSQETQTTIDHSSRVIDYVQWWAKNGVLELNAARMSKYKDEILNRIRAEVPGREDFEYDKQPQGKGANGSNA